MSSAQDQFPNVKVRRRRAVMSTLRLGVVLLIFVCIFSDVSEAARPPKRLGNADLRAITTLTSSQLQFFNQTLNNIMIVRVAGSAGLLQVNQFIVGQMSGLNWNVEQDVFTASTPLGEKTFRNIIATLNPQACQRLVFACHYDSKYFPNAQFVAATDSAVPCAQLVFFAKTLDSALKHHKQNQPNAVTLQFIFFDGEEAFREWTNSDSLYGSRHLAAKWSKQAFPVGDDATRCQGDFGNELKRIELFVLLDLLGAKDPRFENYFPPSDYAFSRLKRIERKLGNLKRLEGRTSYFGGKSSSGIDDDHKPFLSRGVPILHLIANPFPRVWHTPSDNGRNLDHPTINNLNKMLKVFIAEYMHLDVIKLG